MDLEIFTDLVFHTDLEIFADFVLHGDLEFLKGLQLQIDKILTLKFCVLL